MTGDFKALERQLIRAIEKAHRSGVQAIGDRAKELCPVDTGRTRDSIKINPEGGTVSTDYYTSYWLELGTSEMPPRPFLRPAFDHGVRPMVRDIKNAINQELGG